VTHGSMRFAYSSVNYGSWVSCALCWLCWVRILDFGHGYYFTRTVHPYVCTLYSYMCIFNWPFLLLRFVVP
jgi:hypothetical protein